ncbi:family 16 glycosylhydrolase [Christiangramia sp. SM2212]|uniref:Family 16 glycosylhydrolase n=1 Tax=Christiangramia sediminicola TaxID=3073267 RepID=A0ABU1ELH5_9FLAO|nr:family 16 glycosylhydrolase [Christiangramia sp. SM2212]MDR5589235.1 family 16 glycosylhydrolase [Christiangramia sp. SM2212]
MKNTTLKRLKNYAFFIFMIFGIQNISAQCPNIVWQDEFDGNSLDLTKWNYQIGDGCDQNICGWGNNELQSYQQDNVEVSNGTLKITARKERIRGSQYTSGRINSKGKGDFTYGRFEASIKLPQGDGLWPAFWMLSTNETYGSWPQSGEIDIMEYVASTPDEILGYIHYGDLYPNNQSQGNTYNLLNDVYYNDFHEFAIEWEPGEIRWYMDGILFSTKTPEDLDPANWPFDKDFHFLLNVAVGGNLGGPVTDSMLPATMEVDYVRVYDSFKPSIKGENVVSNQEEGVIYTLDNLNSGTNVNWTVPNGATVVSGQGTNSATFNFGSESGTVTASFDDGCASRSLRMQIEVEPPYVKSFSFENFDEPATATFDSATGTLTEVSNPGSNSINSSSLSGKYDRNSQEQYDLVVYNVSNFNDASLYTKKDRKFYLDVYTSAPIGTEIILQLETTEATASNFPTGRHSRYVATITENNNWQRLEFDLLDRPDPAASNSGVSKMILLFNSNSFTGDTYYYDNLDSYEVDNGTSTNQDPTVTITDPTDGAEFNTGETISITANASDADGTISNVEFFIDGVSAGTSTSAPYSVDWQVTQGSSEITAIATDDQNATATSAIVSVTGISTGSATSMHVASITTGTASAGKGAKFGTATVSIIDDLGNPVQGANVTATFSGSFSEQVSAVTDNQGNAALQTQNSAKGTVIVELCVDDVTSTSLAYAPSENALTCTNTNKQASTLKTISVNENDKLTEEPEIKFLISPNPTRNVVRFSLEDIKSANQINIYDMSGRMMLKRRITSETGQLDISDFPQGVYIVKIQNEKNETKTVRLVKK